MKTMTVAELASEFDDCWDETERLKLILELGRGLDPLADEFKTEENLELYAATLPSESQKLMISKLASNRSMDLMYADASRA